MKLITTTFIFCLSCFFQFGLAQNSLPEVIDLTVTDQPVEEVIKQLKEKYNLRFAYSRSRLPLSQKVSINAKKMKLEDFLSSTFHPAKIDYKIVGTQIILKKKRALVTRLELPAPALELAPLDLTQTIRGTITDSDSKQPLVGASVWVYFNEQVKGVTTDVNGQFKIESIPIGRHSIQISYIGYKAKQIENVLLISGKEVILSVELDELITALKEIVIKANPEVSRPVNEMSLANARSFSVEEISRYAGSIQDPARLMTNYAGVTSGSSDPTENAVSVRGNSPTANLWRLEGVDIPNPNHYATLGSNGGAISMLSTSTLTRSDFLLGGYPADYGNVLGGVFDLKFRDGNTEKQEFSFSAGTLGIEASVEGPITEIPRASFLVNYRFSSLFILDRIGINPTDDELSQPPFFQDVSFKVKMPTKKWGEFNVFGLGGINNTVRDPLRLDYNTKDTVALLGWKENGRLAIAGAHHKYSFSDGGFIKTTGAFSHFNYFDDNYLFLNIPDGSQLTPTFTIPAYQEIIDNNLFSISTAYTKKVDVKNTFRIGGNYNHRFFKYNFDVFEADFLPSADTLASLRAYGYTNFFQAQLQWKHKFNNSFSINAGLHSVYYGINQNFSIEPRLTLAWQMNRRVLFTLNATRHSKLLHEAYYLISGFDVEGNNVAGNDDLDVIKSWHFGLGSKVKIGKNTELKSEIYYQYLYNVPVAESNLSIFTQVNSSSVWNLIGPQNWINLGTSQNYGLELTLERRFADSWYILSSLSLFESQYSNDRITQNPTRFDQEYSYNLAGGKEFYFGKNNKNVFGINARFIFEGGQPYTPIDLDASIAARRTIYDVQNPFSEKLESIKRLDFGGKIQINKASITHTFQLDVQNAALQTTQRDIYFNPLNNEIEIEEGLSIIPVLLYRVEF